MFKSLFSKKKKNPYFHSDSYFVVIYFSKQGFTNHLNSLYYIHGSNVYKGEVQSIILNIHLLNYQDLENSRFTERKKIALRPSLVSGSQLVLKGKLTFLVLYFLSIKCFSLTRG